MRGPESLIRAEIRALSAYQAPEPNDLIKLSTHENPYQWPQPLVDEWLAALRDVPINRYPDAGTAELKRALREYLGLDSQAPMVLGNGSDELIQLVVMAVAAPQCKVLAPSPTFVMYRHIATTLGAAYTAVPLDDSFELNRGRMLKAIEAERPSVIFISHPNNPTGNLFDRDLIDAVLETTDGLLVIDEAYAPFANNTYLDVIDQHPNLLVMRTLSKMGLAGLRLGILLGDERWLSEIEKLRLPYNINALTQASACFALRHRQVFDEQTTRICEDRAVLQRKLQAFDSLEVFPTAANFVMFRTPVGEAGRISRELEAKGVSIKNLDGSEASLANCLRVSVGTPDENRAFLDALASTL